MLLELRDDLIGDGEASGASPNWGDLLPWEQGLFFSRRRLHAGAISHFGPGIPWRGHFWLKRGPGVAAGRPGGAPPQMPQALGRSCRPSKEAPLVDRAEPPPTATTGRSFLSVVRLIFRTLRRLFGAFQREPAVRVDHHPHTRLDCPISVRKFEPRLQNRSL